MKNQLVFFLHIIFIMTVTSKTHSVKDLKNVFKDELCIEGNINSIYSKKTDTVVVKSTKTEGLLNLTSVGTVQESEKPVLSRLNELVGFNQIDYYFKLENEEGPPHNRLFTVELTLGKEKYIGKGKSLKKAKQEAATKALEKTEYDFPEIKNNSPEDIEELTPTVLLNNIASKLGVGVTYYLLDKNKEEILHSNIIMTDKKKSYLQRLNASIYNDKKLRKKKEIESTKGPFRLKLKFADYTFFTTSHSIQGGRHEVAVQALEYLVKNKDSLDIACLQEGSEAECKQNKDYLKSPISKVYEEAEKRKMSIECEVIKESGMSHKKKFKTECRLGDIITEGEGFSKKESKRDAAINMLAKIAELEPLPIEEEARNFIKNDKKQKNRRKNKKNKLIKTKFDEIGMMLDKVGESIKTMTTNIFGEEDQNMETKEGVRIAMKHIVSEKKEEL
uniref:Double-stranded RNA-binding protein Staufen homolog 2-like n=1 Tax=Diabrotica virgifera virgifera TaxID=50390 RepID=A0A6P7GWD1_DIAVI